MYLRSALQDISEQKRAEEHIEFLAYYDSLTELPNRKLAKDRAEQILHHAKRDGTKVAFILIDIDNFNAINSSLGQESGNILINSIGSKIKKSMRESDIVSRHGGDEFLVVVTGLGDISGVVHAIEKIREVFEAPFILDGHVFSITASIGIALYPEGGEEFCTLFQKAEIAMYTAKAEGKNTYSIFQENMNQNLIAHLELNTQIKNALKNNEFILHYQPQVDPLLKTIVGVEALIRWKHPLRGMVPPSEFISVAESSGLIVHLGEWIIHEACRQAALWQEKGMGVCVAVNISAVQFKRSDLKRVIKDALQFSGLRPENLELELTESILMHDAENTLEAVRELKNLGIKFSIDDFGTGYSSLAYLKRFAVDKLKIDRSFVIDILHDKDDAAIVNTIIQMAKTLNLKTIAEGVENQEVTDALMRYGCDEIQGFHFAKPMEAEMFCDFYRRYGV